MKFQDMPYTRPDPDELKREYELLADQLRAAENYEQARTIFRKRDQAARRVDTLFNLSLIRHSLDTRDAFYEGESNFWDETMPELEEYNQLWMKALLESPFRSRFEAEFGDVPFRNAELAQKAFAPAIIPQMQQDNHLSQEYERLLSVGKVCFEGKEYTIPQMAVFKTDADDARRLAAWKAEGQWYKDNQPELDRIYDELVKLRDSMGKALGYEGYTQLAYYQMQRNCYDRQDVERFRQAVVDYVVPVAQRIFQERAQRLGVSYPMSFADAALLFRSGNPKPVGTPEEIVQQGMTFFGELSPETKEFYEVMLEGNLIDVANNEGKENGGYCTGLPDYGVPFIFSCSDGTQNDVGTITHEGGHAFQYYVNRDREPMECICPGMEACEVHSTAMEFFAGKRSAELFFGEDAEKYRYMQVVEEIAFLPYGTMVDHFQHEVYDHPELTPKERHGVWKRLLQVYMPWLKLDGDIPFYAEGEGWQRQHHIYSSPFYYIDYCLATTVALELWAMMEQDEEKAWQAYMAYTLQGGSRTFTDLLAHAGLKSPFDAACLREVCATAQQWLGQRDADKLV